MLCEINTTYYAQQPVEKENLMEILQIFILFTTCSNQEWVIATLLGSTVWELNYRLASGKSEPYTVLEIETLTMLVGSDPLGTIDTDEQQKQTELEL